jgi:hypothetical protein
MRSAARGSRLDYLVARTTLAEQAAQLQASPAGRH